MEFGKTETQNETKIVVNNAYPAIVVPGKFAAGNGVIEAGTPVAFDANDLYAPYVFEDATTLGVLVGLTTKDVDTDAAGGAVGPVMRMGLARLEALTNTTADTLKALAAEKIFAY